MAVIAVGLFLWWFFRGDAPDAVSIDDAAAQVIDDITTEEVATETAATEPVTAPVTASTSVDTTITDSSSLDFAGVWSVDTSIGEFNYEDSTGTFVGFRIAEELSGIGSTTAVGRTPEVTGTLTIDGTTVTSVTIEADMSAITTNESRRDDKVQSALDTGGFPTATFVLTEPIELGKATADGEAVSVDAIGELTIHGVTTTVTIPLDAQLVDGTVVVVGSLEISFADYGVSVPSAPVVLSVDDHGEIELQLFFTR